MEKEINCYYIGKTLNDELRYKSSSGGIGSSIIQFLLSQPEYSTSMTFIYKKENYSYEPSFIYSFDDYNNIGSIYQDTDTIGFIRKNIEKIRGDIIVTCMPCQVKAIRSILNRNNINSFIISLCCSGQTTVEGTWYYYKLLGIKKEDVESIQYRGNGWPSGIQIKLKNGRYIKRGNWTYPWTLMHNSLLFRPKRCLSCPFKTTVDADVNLADPWLKEYESDRIGHSIVITNSSKASSIIKIMQQQKIIECLKIDENTYIRSQKGTINEKKLHKDRQSFNEAISWLSSSQLYMRIVKFHPFLMKIHCRFILKIIKKICI